MKKKKVATHYTFLKFAIKFYISFKFKTLLLTILKFSYLKKNLLRYRFGIYQNLNLHRWKYKKKKAIGWRYIKIKLRYKWMRLKNKKMKLQCSVILDWSYFFGRYLFDTITGHFEKSQNLFEKLSSSLKKLSIFPTKFIKFIEIF